MLHLLPTGPEGALVPGPLQGGNPFPSHAGTLPTAFTLAP